MRFVLKMADEAITPPPPEFNTPAGKTGWEIGCLQMQVRYLRSKLQDIAAKFEAAQGPADG